MTVKERIKIFAKSQEKSVRAFEIRSGLNIGYINAIRVSIQPDKIQSIALAYPNLNLDWLLTGKGQMLTPPISEGLNNSTDEQNEEMEKMKIEIAYLKEALKDKQEIIIMMREKINALEGNSNILKNKTASQAAS